MKLLMKLKIWLLIFFVKLFKGYAKISTKVIYSQAWHETGDFSSQVFKDNKNLFGMRHPKSRETNSQGSKHNHAYYKSHFDSILDYFERQTIFRINNKEDSLFIENTVKSGYATDPHYKSKWENIINNVVKKDLRIFNLSFFFALSIILSVYFIKKLKKKK